MTYRKVTGPSGFVETDLLSSSRVGWRGCRSARCQARSSCTPTSLAGDLLGDGDGGVVVQLFDHALVGVAGKGGSGLAGLLRDDLDVDASCQGDRRGAVSQVMQPDRRHSAAFDQAPDSLGDTAGMPRMPVRADEEQAGVGRVGSRGQLPGGAELPPGPDPASRPPRSGRPRTPPPSR